MGLSFTFSACESQGHVDLLAAFLGLGFQVSRQYDL